MLDLRLVHIMIRFDFRFHSVFDGFDVSIFFWMFDLSWCILIRLEVGAESPQASLLGLQLVVSVPPAMVCLVWHQTP